MKLFRKFLCKLSGHPLEHVRMREGKFQLPVAENKYRLVVEHTFICKRCGLVAYRESMAYKQVNGPVTAVMAFGPAKWTGITEREVR